MKQQYIHKRGTQYKVKHFGFTLLELMIIVTVVAILTAIAVPSYQRASAKSDRSIAIADINEISQALERYFTHNRVYTNNFGNLRMAGNNTFALNDSTGKYTYMIGIPNSTAIGSVPQANTTGQSYVIYAAPTANLNRDTWTLSQNHMGFQQSYAEGSTTAQDGWPH